MMEFVELNQVVDLISGYAIPSGDMVGDYARVIKITNIKEDGSIDLENTVGYCKPIEKRLSKYLLRDNDIIVCMTGATIGKVARVSKVNGTYIVNQRVAIIRAKTEEEQNYYYQILSMPLFRRYTELVGYGAAQPNISLSQIGKFSFLHHSSPIDRLNVASVLSSFQYLIENNQKRIKLLEQMAENLYKEWFVRFRFPGYETVDHKSSALGTIPETFTVECMGNIMDYYIGGGWGQDTQSDEYPQDAYVIRGTDFPKVQVGDVTSCPHRYHKASNYKARKLNPLDIILEVSGGTQEQPVGRTVIVTENLLNRLGNTVICASFCKQVRIDKKKVLPFYFYYWMQFMYDTRMIDKFQLQSTGIINFKFEYFLRKGLIAIPPMSLMEQFSALVEPLFAEKDKLSEQICNLTTQRDLLLPRLMSGKLSI